MKNKKLIVAAIILCSVLATTIVICRPYNYVELNAGAIYYQSYKTLYLNASQYVGMLENYNESRDEIYLERALIKLDAIRDSIWTFRIANGMSFRNTYINEKVVKTDFLGLQNLERLETYYYSSRNVFEEFLKGEVVLDDKSLEDFTHYNQLILNGLQTNDVGYNSETKEFRVVIDDSKRPILEEGLDGLEKILIRVITRTETPNMSPPSIMVDGELYFSTGEEIPIEPDESAIKTVTSVIKGTELPSKEAEINFPVPDTKYAKINDSKEYVVVLMNHEWVRFEKEEDTLGIKLTTTKITPTGLTLVFNQSGGNPTGDLQTGSMYWLEIQTDNQWNSVETLPSEYDVAWTAEAYIISMNSNTEWEGNWEWLYGELPDGNYRIGKEIMDFRGGGDYDIFTYYANFEIVN